MFNICPINVMPLNIAPADIPIMIKTTIDRIMELRSHINKKFSCVNKIYSYIEKKDINMIVSQLEFTDDPIVSDALIKLNEVLTKTYNLISAYKLKYHVKCIDYATIIENIDIRMNVLNIRMELHKYNTLDAYCKSCDLTPPRSRTPTTPVTPTKITQSVIPIKSDVIKKMRSPSQDELQ